MAGSEDPATTWRHAARGMALSRPTPRAEGGAAAPRTLTGRRYTATRRV